MILCGVMSNPPVLDMGNELRAELISLDNMLTIWQTVRGYCWFVDEDKVHYWHELTSLYVIVYCIETPLYRRGTSPFFAVRAVQIPPKNAREIRQKHRLHLTHS
jgi:hypothetical protein